MGSCICTLLLCLLGYCLCYYPSLVQDGDFMTSSPQDELQEILSEARRLTAAAEPGHGRQTSRRQPDGFDVYRALCPFRIGMAWWLALLSGPAAIGVLSLLPGPLDERAQWLIWGASAMATGRIVLGLILWIARFFHFRHWRDSLTLRVEGWDALVSSDNFTDYRYWRVNCTVQLHLRSNASPTDETLQTLLFMFRTEANHCGYPAALTTETDPRRAWQQTGPTTLTGSFNCAVGRHLYELCQHLSVLNRVEPTVESLLITADDTETPIRPLWVPDYR